MTLINKSLLGHFLCRYLQNLSPSAKVSDETSYFVQAWIDVVRETNLNSWECDKLIASEASGPQKNLKMGLRGNFKLCGYGPRNIKKTCFEIKLKNFFSARKNFSTLFQNRFS